MAIPKKIAALITSLVILFLFPLPIHAAERSFDILDVDISARIDEFGNMIVIEHDTYQFSGAFNGILVELDASGSDGIENFQAFEVTSQQEIPLIIEKSEKGKHIQYKIFNTAKDETKVYKFTYEIKNVVQIYEDTADLYWKFFDKSNSSELKKVNIRVELPGGIAKEEILAFGHGPLTGLVEVHNDGLVDYMVSPLPKQKMLEVRILFPKSYVSSSTKVKDTPMLETIKQQEIEWAEEADNQWAWESNKWKRSLMYAGALLLINIVFIIFLYFKYGREHKPEWTGKYYRELPEDITPAVVSYLMDYRIQSKDLMATLIDLVRKKHVEIEVVKKVEGLFHREKTDYLFRLINEDTSQLKQHEAFLIGWFFNQLGHGNEVSLSDIRQFAKRKLNATAYALRFKEWQEKVIQEAKQNGYFDLSKKGRNIALLFAIAQISAIFLFAAESDKWMFVCAIPLFFNGLKIKRRTKAGATELRKWKAFRQFLHDYSQLKSREPMAVYLWEQFLVYGISLGVAKKVIAIANSNLVLVDHQNYAVYRAVQDDGLYHHFDHFTDSFDKALNTARSNSSRGSGGGFSSGGGSGGGGGGRGAF